MHRYLLREFGVDGCYYPFERTLEALPLTIASMRNLEFTGFNVTIPYKERILSYLDDVSEQVNFVGAANTIHNRDGKLFGHNTDGVGFISALLNKGQTVKKKAAVILGSGGAARGVLFNLCQNAIAELHILNRTAHKAERLADKLQRIFPEVNISCDAFEEAVVTQKLAMSDLVINTTSLGMWPETEQAPYLFREDASHLVVYDLVYNPLDTAFLRSAKRFGATPIDGLDMFIFQGVEALKIWLHGETEFEFDYLKLRTFLTEQLHTYEPN
jgi:shikimate dehydrogenase